MSTKAQEGSIGFIFSVVFTLIVLALIGGQVLGLFTIAATLGHLSGFALFIMSNFAVWIILGLALAVVLFFWRGRR